MNLTIHRGTHEIGGNCVEICSGQTRIIIDLGMPLVDIHDKKKKFESFSIRRKTVPQLLEEGILPPVKGLYEGIDDGKVGSMRSFYRILIRTITVSVNSSEKTFPSI